MSIVQIREDLKKLAKLAANVSDAHTCSIFLPTGLLTSSTPARSSEATSCNPHAASSQNHGSQNHGKQSDTIELKKIFHLGPDLTIGSIEMVATHSSSTCLVRDCRIQVGNGLIGWVAENSRSIHVAPFDMDSSVLGIYTETEPLKSLVAVPIPMPTENPNSRIFSGVLMCDSRKAFAFTKPQMKHLEEIATLISRLLFWTLFKKETTSSENSWDSFLTKTTQLSEAIGHDSIELVRISLESFGELEASRGLSNAVHQSEQFVRLVQQALPPHFPLVRLPNGDILVALDNMMTAFFQNKIRTLANHLNDQVQPFVIRLQSFSAKASRARGFDIDTILKAMPTPTTSTIGKVVGGSRA
ncbi:MAG: hypothetical protein RIS36_2219 [Pseudomonadota bacterium]|jgi:hypothetical protein